MALSLRSSRLGSIALASIIAVGVIGAGSAALADGPGPGPRPMQGERAGHPVKLGIQSLLKDSGVTREELKEGAAAGLTLGQIIDQYGDISAADAKANALATLAERLDAAVAAGNLTGDRADEIEAAAAALLDRLLAAVPGADFNGPQPRAKVFAIAKHSLETVAEVLGTDIASIRQQLAAGETVAGIAGDRTQAVIDALVEDANTAIDNAVAAGRLPAGNAETAKARAAAAIEKFVNEGRPERPGHPLRNVPRPGAR